MGIFIFCYLALLIFTICFVDADSVFDARALVPVHHGNHSCAVLVVQTAERVLLHHDFFRGSLFA